MNRSVLVITIALPLEERQSSSLEFEETRMAESG